MGLEYLPTFTINFEPNVGINIPHHTWSSNIRRLIQDPDFLTNQDFTEPSNLAPPFFGWEIFRLQHEANQKKDRPPTSRGRPPNWNHLAGDFATRRLHRSDGGTAAALEEFPRLQWMERVGIGVDRGEL